MNVCTHSRVTRYKFESLRVRAFQRKDIFDRDRGKGCSFIISVGSRHMLVLAHCHGERHFRWATAALPKVQSYVAGVALCRPCAAVVRPRYLYTPSVLIMVSRYYMQRYAEVSRYMGESPLSSH